MKFTIYSEIIKIENEYFIVELYKNKNEEEFLKISKVNKNSEKPNLYFCDPKVLYNQQSLIIIKNKDLNKTIKRNLKKELTLDFSEFTKNHYIIYLKKHKTIKKILELNF